MFILFIDSQPINGKFVVSGSISFHWRMFKSGCEFTCLFIFIFIYYDYVYSYLFNHYVPEICDHKNTLKYFYGIL